MKDNVGLIKSEAFGVRIMKLYNFLVKEDAPKPIVNQITKSGTSIGANLFEAECAISDKEFLSKVYISLKECNETKYWLRLLYTSGYLQEKLYDSLYKDAEELFKILSSTTNTLRQRLNNK